MKQGLLERRVAWRFSVFSLHLCLVALMLSSMGGCGKSGNLNSGRSIFVDRQVVLPGFGGNPQAIVRLPDGGYVVVGAFGTGWAVATNSVGETRWKYQEPFQNLGNSTPQSDFSGAAALDNGNVLLCGSKLKAGQQSSALIVVDKNGQVVEQQIGFVPVDDKTIISSDFAGCYPWDGGIVVVGDIRAVSQSYGWVIKLDKNGSRIWEKFYKYAKNPPLANMTGPSFVRVAYKSSATGGLIVIRENSQGEVMARREAPGDHSLQLRSVEPTENTSIISYTSGKAELYTLDEHLADAKAPFDIGHFYAVGGSGYVLADGSLVLFGRTNNAAVAWISESGKEHSELTFDLKSPSFIVNDAVPISTNQFVTIRISGGQDEGLVMAWVTIK